MSDLRLNAITFLQKRFPQATVMNNELHLRQTENGNIVQTIWPMIVQDPNAGIKQRAFAIANLGNPNTIEAISGKVNEIFNKLDEGVYVGFNATEPKGHPINTTQMPFAPKIIFYTDQLILPYADIINHFSKFNMMVEIVCEADMSRSLFISYGGPDKKAASKINGLLKKKGIKTWFFPDDSLPGQKLHRVMHEGVNNYDRVLLICSKNSLTRPGVLNELERVLEREAKEGGSEILIPITLDDFVYSDWAPDRPDLADQIRSRVITKVNALNHSTADSKKQLNKLVMALAKK